MKENQIAISWDDEHEMKTEWIQLEKAITDRGSKYSITAGRVRTNTEIKQFLKKVKSNKKYAKATHNTYAVRVRKDGKVYESKNDDGETGAGMVILRQLRNHNWVNIVVVVTRWFGGIQLHADRFRHVQDGTDMILNVLETKKE